MATSAYSGVNQSQIRGGYESVDYIGQVQQAIQGKIDINKEKANQVLSQFQNVDLARVQDREKFVSKLQGIVGYMNGADGIDFRDSSLPSAINAELQGAFDQETMKHISNTRNIRKFEAEVASKKAEGKGKYSAKNEWYARRQAGLDSYMSGDSDDLSTLSYVDNVDVHKYINDETTKYIKTSGEVKNVEYDAQGQPDIMLMKKTSTVDGDRVRNFINGLIDNSPEIQQQLMINGAYDYQNVPEEQMQIAYRGEQDSKIKANKDEIARLTGVMGTMSKDNPNLKQVEDHISNINEANDNLSKSRDLKLDRSQYEFMLSRDRIVNSLVKSHEKYEVTDVKMEDIYFQHRNILFNNELKASRLKMEQERLDLARTKLQASIDKSKGILPTVTDTPIDELSAMSETFYDKYTKDFSDNMSFMENYHMEHFGMTKEQAQKASASAVENLGKGEIDFGATQYSAEFVSRAMNAYEYTKTSKEIDNKAYDEYMTNIVPGYIDALINSDRVDFDALARFNPNISRVILQAKSSGLGYENLDKRDQALLAAEVLVVADNLRGENDGDMGGQGVMDVIKRRLYLDNPGIEEELNPIAGRADKAEIITSFGRGIGRGVTGLADIIRKGSNLVASSVDGNTGEAMRNVRGIGRVAGNTLGEVEKYNQGIKDGFFRLTGWDSNTNTLSQRQTGHENINSLVDELKIRFNEMKRDSFNNKDEVSTMSINHTVTFNPDDQEKAIKQLVSLGASQGTVFKDNLPISIRRNEQNNSYIAYQTIRENKESVPFSVEFNMKDAPYVASLVNDATNNYFETADNVDSPIYNHKYNYSIPRDIKELSEIQKNLSRYNPGTYNREYFKSDTGLIDRKTLTDSFNNLVSDVEIQGEFQQILDKEYQTRVIYNYAQVEPQVVVLEKGTEVPVHIFNSGGTDLGGLTTEKLRELTPYAISQYIKQQGNKLRVKEENNKR